MRVNGMKIRHLGCLAVLLLVNSCLVTDKSPRYQIPDTTDLVWTGHLKPDSDSVFSAIGAATLYGGRAVVPGNINREAGFALDYCKLNPPEEIQDFSLYKVALVDTNQASQIHPSIDPENIVAVIDHHALRGGAIELNTPILIDIRPFGATATSLAMYADRHKLVLPESVACGLLAAILSDTLILNSPTTTDIDKHYVKWLADSVGVGDIQAMGKALLEAKSDLAQYSDKKVILADYKTYNISGKKLGVGVAETLTPEILLRRKSGFIKAINQQRQAQALDWLFFAIVDTQRKQSYLVLASDREAQLATQAFKAHAEERLMVLKGVVSRKRQLMPALQRVISAQ